MKKKVAARSLLGFPIGVFIGESIIIVSSLILGAYTPVMAQLVEQTGGVLSAVMTQYVLSGILGAAFAGASCIWEMQDWSLLKQTAIHLVVSVAVMFPVAWLAWWMPHSAMGVLIYVAIFLVLYAVMYVVNYLFWRARVRKMDRYIQQGHRTDEGSM